jgi:hypothetical protein
MTVDFKYGEVLANGLLMGYRLSRIFLLSGILLVW